MRAWFSMLTMPEAAAEQLLDQVVLFVVQRGAAERADAERVVHDRAVGQRLDEGLVARLLGELGDALHRPVERLCFPLFGVGRAVQDMVDALLATAACPACRRPSGRACLGSPGCAGRPRCESACRSWRRRVGRSRPRRTGRCWCRPVRLLQPWPQRPGLVLFAASAITFSPANWRGNDQSREEACGAITQAAAETFHGKALPDRSRPATLCGRSGSRDGTRRANLAFVAAQEAACGPWTGVVTIVQEGRFQLLDDDGVSHQFLLGIQRGAAEPEQLPDLLQQRRSRVAYSNACQPDRARRTPDRVAGDGVMDVHPRALDHSAIRPGPIIPDEAELTAGVPHRARAVLWVLHRHHALHRLQGLRGGLQGMEQPAGGQPRPHRSQLRQYRARCRPTPGGTSASSSMRVPRATTRRRSRAAG